MKTANEIMRKAGSFEWQAFSARLNGCDHLLAGSVTEMTRIVCCIAVFLLLHLTPSASGQQPNLADLLDQESQPGAGNAELAPPKDLLLQADARKSPLPPATDLRRAAERVKAVFANDLREASTPEQKAEAARSMLRIAADTVHPAEKYALLELCQRLAVDGRDVNTFTAALKSTEDTFGIDTTKLKVEGLLVFTKTAPRPELAPVIDVVLSAAEARREKGDIDTAMELVKAGALAARRLGNPAVQRKTTELIRELRDQLEEQARIEPMLERLKQDPRDVEAAFEVGKYRCFVEGSWESGLPLLARAADPLWAAAAKLDLQPSKSSAALVRTGDAWARVHEAQRSREPTPASLRARDCYQKALGEATGLDRAGIMKKLDALGEAEGGATGNWFVVFRSDNPTDWNKKMNEGFQRYAVPLSEAPSPVRYIRIRRMNGESVVLPANGLKLAVDGVAGNTGGLADRSNSMATFYSASMTGKSRLPARQEKFG